MRPHRVLFVCMGNICRSPAGEGLFHHYVSDKGEGDGFEIDSAGTIGYHVGEPPDPRMTSAARNRGIDLSVQRSRKFERTDFENFDVIVVMDSANEKDILAQAKTDDERARVVRMLQFHPIPEEAGKDVPDPYYGGPQGFDNVLDLIEASCPGLYQHIVE